MCSKIIKIEDGYVHVCVQRKIYICVHVYVLLCVDAYRTISTFTHIHR